MISGWRQAGRNRPPLTPDRPSAATLDGTVVAVFGNAHDCPGGLARALADLGASVLVCAVWSPYFDPPDENDLLALVEPATAYPGRVQFLSGFDGEPFSELFYEPPRVRRFVSWARRSFGRLDAVVLGFLSGLGLAAGDSFASALRRTGGEAIAIEGDAASADQLVRTFAEVEESRRPTVMRHSAGRKRKPSGRIGRVAEALVQSGLLAEVTIADVERAAAARRRRGDPIAGLLWRPIGGGDYDHGGCAIVTARSLEAVGPLSDVDRVEWYRKRVTPLDELGLDGMIISHDNGIATVDVAPARSKVVALRVGTLDDSFDTDEPYVPVGEWRPAHRDVVVGDPWVVLVDRGGVRLRLDAQPVWHIDLAVLDREMTGFRVWSDAARHLAASRH
jgi:NAD(P)-dependent dehydrogenase (short-subunit alcohol dehydrogenase family)